MDPQALPTPYDIVLPPPAPYTPGLLSWLAVAFLALGGIALWRWLARQKRRTGEVASLQDQCDQIIDQMRREARTQGVSPLLLGELHRLLRRVLSELLKVDLTAASAKELQLQVEQKADHLTSFAAIASELEHSRYGRGAPSGEQFDLWLTKIRSTPLAGLTADQDSGALHEGEYHASA